MGMRINTNIEAFNAQRNLSITASNYAKSVEKLSSGLRINRAGDDAAGLSISEKLRAQIRGLGQAQRNAQDGISMIQTGEGALNEVHSILQRMRELSVQASNGTLTSSDQTAISTELTQLGAEIDRIGNTTQFNSKTLLSGALNTTVSAGSGVLAGQILATSGAVVSQLDVSNATASHTFNLTGCSTTGTLTLTDATTNVSQTLTVQTLVGSATGSETLDFSTLGVSLTLSGCSASTTAANLVTDLVAKSTIQTATTGGAVLFQIGANANQTMSVSLSDTRSTAIGNGGTYANLSVAVSSFATAVSNGTGASAAQNLMQSIDQAITDVSNNRSNLGAAQNRLEHTIANLGVAQENLTASESRIRDVDMAAEMVNFTKTGILQQAGQAILAQANQAPSGVLSLLRG
ncbi:MAG TPA: flagellin [Chloroflexota bacterium]|nr:flagellin [Chloroflexota bacterium]